MNKYRNEFKKNLFISFFFFLQDQWNFQGIDYFVTLTILLVVVFAILSKYC